MLAALVLMGPSTDSQAEPGDVNWWVNEWHNTHTCNVAFYLLRHLGSHRDLSQDLALSTQHFHLHCVRTCTINIIRAATICERIWLLSNHSRKAHAPLTQRKMSYQWTTITHKTYLMARLVFHILCTLKHQQNWLSHSLKPWNSPKPRISTANMNTIRYLSVFGLT